MESPKWTILFNWQLRSTNNQLHFQLLYAEFFFFGGGGGGSVELIAHDRKISNWHCAVVLYSLKSLLIIFILLVQ